MGRRQNGAIGQAGRKFLSIMLYFKIVLPIRFDQVIVLVGEKQRPPYERKADERGKDRNPAQNPFAAG